MAWKSVLKPEGSLTMGAAVAGIVYANYSLSIGPVSGAQASDAHHPILETSRKKAGYSSLILVAGIALLARDPNIVILGGAAIVIMEASYRHAIMAHPVTGQMMPPAALAYSPAETAIPLDLQAQAG
jgi:hypothetical protein